MGKHGSLEPEGKNSSVESIVKGGKKASGLADGFEGHGMGRAWLKRHQAEGGTKKGRLTFVCVIFFPCLCLYVCVIV